jgi:hypothetical protein
MFAMNPDSIVSRIVNRSYGVDRALYWDSPRHVILPLQCKSHKFGEFGEDIVCQNHYDPIVDVGDRISPIQKYSLVRRLLHPKQDKLMVTLYCTAPYQRAPNRVGPHDDDISPDLTVLGQVVVDVPPSLTHYKNRIIRIEFVFSTHIHITAVDVESNKTAHALLEFPASQ